MIFDHYSVEQANKHIAEIMELVQRGNSKTIIKERFDLHDFEEFHSIARARVKNKNPKYSKAHSDLFFTLEDLRFATEKSVAEHRADRLKCSTIVEIGSGIGLQSIAFAKKCSKVIAIELDKRKFAYSKKNAEALGINNIEFVNGDALAELKKIKEADIVFCEPERPAEEGARNLESLRPAIKQLLEVSKRITEKLCIELPPQISLEKLDELGDSEKEFASVNGELRRLNLYFGSLKKANFSALALPEGARIESESSNTNFDDLPKSNALKFLYEADAAAAKVGLVHKLFALDGLLLFAAGKRIFLTSEKLIQNPFFADSFKVLHQCENNDGRIIELLRKENCKELVLRASIDPKQYWDERKKYESKLDGSKTLYLFKFDSIALICEKL